MVLHTLLSENSWFRCALFRFSSYKRLITLLFQLNIHFGCIQLVCKTSIDRKDSAVFDSLSFRKNAYWCIGYRLLIKQLKVNVMWKRDTLLVCAYHLTEYKSEFTICCRKSY